jgi:hypothetical protein
MAKKKQILFLAAEAPGNIIARKVPENLKTEDPEKSTKENPLSRFRCQVIWISGGRPVNGMVRRRSLEVVECGDKEASHETSRGRH